MKQRYPVQRFGRVRSAPDVELCAVRLRHTVSVPAVDPQLLQRARAGDSAAFGELIRPHLPSVRRFAYAFARHWSDADDLAQEALLKAYRAIGGYEGRASLATWLYSVTRSVCLDHSRSKLAHARKAEDPLEDHAEHVPASPHAGPDGLLEAKGEAERLWRALKTLPSEFRVPLVLFEIEGLGYEEIAHIESVPIGTIRSRLSRGRLQLKALLAEVESLPASRAGTRSDARSSNSGSARA
jgi:RNA polymerase sigma-70 factor (ECF subfamily)